MFPHENVRRGAKVKKSGAIFHVTESLSLVDTCIGEMMEDQLNRQERARILLAAAILVLWLLSCSPLH
jgi:hypothetical protein